MMSNFLYPPTFSFFAFFQTSPHATMTQDEEREKIMEDLEALEDWLYEDGEDGGANAGLDVYKEKRKTMQNRVKAIFLRLVELEARPKSVEAARAVIASAKEVMLLWPAERPQLLAEDISEVEEVMASVATWLDEKEEEQKAKDTTDTPAFTSREVSNKMSRLNNLVARMLKKKRAAPQSVDDLFAAKGKEQGEKNEESGEEAGEDAKEGEGMGDAGKEQEEETAGSAEEGESTSEEETRDEASNEEL